MVTQWRSLRFPKLNEACTCVDKDDHDDDDVGGDDGDMVMMMMMVMVVEKHLIKSGGRADIDGLFT